MPIWLRRFTHKQIYEARSAEAEGLKKSSKGKGTTIDLNNPKNPKIPKEAINPKSPTPNYITKASKK